MLNGQQKFLSKGECQWCRSTCVRFGLAPSTVEWPPTPMWRQQDDHSGSMRRFEALRKVIHGLF